MTKIVITGGPCAGKSTAMSWIQNAFADMGYTVLFVSETATELITGGIAPWTCGTNLDFQKSLMRLQLTKEHVFEETAKTMTNDKILIVCDRGILDNKAYMPAAEFKKVLQSLSLTETEIRDNYDAVFHLVTAAKGAEAFYTTSNNQARTETPEEASCIDDTIIASWTGHPHLRVIDNSSDFDGKMSKLISEIASFLGEPEPFEIERKFLIKYPDIQKLESLPNCKKVEIIQTYLVSKNGDETRIRQRGENGEYVYFLTTKHTINGLKRVETERRLSKEEYLRLLMNADTSKKQIRKNRYCWMYENQYFELDVYPFWNNKAILEIELCDENAKIKLPREIEVIKEVTGDPAYKNAILATL